jgi:hypothetical protein
MAPFQAQLPARSNAGLRRSCSTCINPLIPIPINLKILRSPSRRNDVGFAITI